VSLGLESKLLAWLRNTGVDYCLGFDLQACASRQKLWSRLGLEVMMAKPK